MSNFNANSINVKTLNFTGNHMYHRGTPIKLLDEDISGNLCLLNDLYPNNPLEIGINICPGTTVISNLPNPQPPGTIEAKQIMSAALDISGAIQLAFGNDLSTAATNNLGQIAFFPDSSNNYRFWGCEESRNPDGTVSHDTWRLLTSSFANQAYWTQTGNDLYYDGGNVGIGLTDPTEKLDVSGNVKIRGYLDMSCNRIIDISGIYFCDASGSSITGGNSLDISSNTVYFKNKGGTIPILLDVSGDISCNNLDANVSNYKNQIGSFASGFGALNINSTAIGSNCSASNQYSIAMGQNTVATNNNSTAMGGSTTASGAYSTAMGIYSNASTNYSTAIGNRAFAGGTIQFAVGSSPGVPPSIATSSSNNNKFVILTTGNVGIGTDNPTTTLDVSGNVKIRGYLDMSCNRIIDISGISFCSDSSGIDMSCNSIIDVSSITFCGHDGVGIDLSCNTIIDVSGIYFCDGSSFTYGNSLDISGDGISFLTNGDGTEQMKILNGGNVGIGTTGPLTKLEVARLDSASDISNNLLRLSSQITTLGEGPSMEFYVKRVVGGYDRLTAAIEGELIEILPGWHGSGNLVFSTTNTSGTTQEEIMRLGPSAGTGITDAVVVISKSVGIGYGASFLAGIYDLKVNGSSYFNSAVHLNNALHDSATDSPGTIGQVLTSTITGTEWADEASSLWSQSGNDIFYDTGKVGVGEGLIECISQLTIGTTGNFDTDITAGRCFIGVGDTGGTTAQRKRLIGFGYLLGSGTASDHYYPGYIGYQSMSNTGATYGDLIFGTRSTTTDVEATERMRIDYLGNVGIGTSTPSARLEVASGDALINTLTVGLGGGDISSNTVVGYQALQTNTTGLGNVALGYQALQTSDASYNTAVGSQALMTNTGNQNTATGYRALFVNTGGSNVATGYAALANNTGSGNVATGYAALMTNDGKNNTATGYFALKINTGGESNVATGYNALAANKTGSSNVATGSGALSYNKTGSSNVALGYQALFDNSGGFGNTATGHQALYKNSVSNPPPGIGNYNTATGYQALYDNSGGHNNTATGVSALKNNKAGIENVATGNYALSGESGNHNVATGYLALEANRADCNTATGHQALQSNTTGGSNTATGAQALVANQTGEQNTATGYAALNSITTGSYNTATGYNALYFNDASYNVATGYQALQANKYGGYNTAIGASALQTGTDGSFNVATGYAALADNSGGNYNTATGYRALQANTDGTNNVATGSNALWSNTIGGSNVATGYQALNANKFGGYNTAIGASALLTNDASYNTAIGYNAGNGPTDISNTINVGYDTSCNASNTVCIGNADISCVYLGSTSGNAKLDCSGIVTTKVRIGPLDATSPSPNYISDASDSNLEILSNYTVNNFAENNKKNPNALRIIAEVNIPDPFSPLQQYGYGVEMINFTPYMPSTTDERYKHNVSASIIAGVSSLQNYWGNTKGYLAFATSSQLNAATHATQLIEKMRIRSNGFVGIGTQYPAAMLDISANQWNKVSTSPASDIALPYALITKGQVQMFPPPPSDMVGNYLLDVSGNVKIRGDITFDGTTTRYISQAQAPTSSGGNYLVIKAGNAGPASNTSGGRLILKGGEGDGTSAGHFGNVEITGDSVSILGGGMYIQATVQAFLNVLGQCNAEKVYIGASTGNPVCPLEIGTFTQQSNIPPSSGGANYAYWYSNPGQQSNGTTYNVSIKTAAAIWSPLGLIAASDSRIKQNIIEVNDEMALQQLRAIEVKSYDYRDKDVYGEEETIGFIAQQVKTVIPQAVQIHGEYLPDEMREINVVYEPFETTDKHNKEITKYKFIVNNLSGTKYKFKVMSEEDRIMKIIELEKGEDGKFTCDKQYENVYIYGKWVDDFHTLLKSKLFSTNFAATQEIDRIQQAEKTKLEVQTFKLTAAEAKIVILETKNQDLETKLTNLIDQLKANNTIN